MNDESSVATITKAVDPPPGALRHGQGLAIWCMLIVAAAALGYVDYATGFEISFFVFYFLPVGYAAWKLGYRGGVSLSVWSAVVWALADHYSGHVYSQPAYAVWSALVRLTSFLVVGGLIARNAALLAHERAVSGRLRQSLAQVTVLEGLLPICASCKKIRNDQGNWEQMERYIQDRTTAKFSHGYCPDCARKWLREAGLDSASGGG